MMNILPISLTKMTAVLLKDQNYSFITFDLRFHLICLFWTQKTLHALQSATKYWNLVY